MDLLEVAVVAEHGILRRGLVACLHDDLASHVIWEDEAGPVPDRADVVVASTRCAAREPFRQPVVVCATGGDRPGPPHPGNDVLAVLALSHATPARVVAAVHAAANGMRVDIGPRSQHTGLDSRDRKVLSLLTEGCSTAEIARSLNYSERTIKYVITNLEQRLGARNRAHAVAIAIRAGMI